MRRQGKELLGDMLIDTDVDIFLLVSCIADRILFPLAPQWYWSIDLEDGKPLSTYDHISEEIHIVDHSFDFLNDKLLFKTILFHKCMFSSLFQDKVDNFLNDI